MYCTTCGKELPDGVSVCDECGTRYSPEGRAISSGNDTETESGHRPYMDYQPFSSAYENGASNQEPYGQNPYGQNPYGQNAYWKEPYSESSRSGSGRTGFAIASLVLGIIAVCSCCLPIFTIPLGIIAIIFAVLGLNSDNRSIAIAGLILGILSLVFGIMMLVIYFLSSDSHYYFYL